MNNIETPIISPDRTLQRPQRIVPEVAKATNRALDVITGAIGFADDEEYEIVVNHMEEVLNSQRSLDFAFTLARLLASFSLNDFTLDMHDAGISVSRVRAILTNPDLAPLHTIMTKSPWQFNEYFGLVLSQIQLHELPNETQAHFNPLVVRKKISQEPESPKWALCGQSEPLMRKSIETNGTLTLEHNGVPHILMKKEGHLTGICTQDFVTEDGTTFLRGNWYSVYDGNSRQKIYEALDAKRSHMPLMDGSWIFMRNILPVSNTPDDVLLDEFVDVAWCNMEE